MTAAIPATLARFHPGTPPGTIWEWCEDRLEWAFGDEADQLRELSFHFQRWHRVEAIRREPENHGLHLALARVLKDGAGTVACPRCNGKKSWHDALTGDGRCFDCHGTGRVSDGRAELIRADVELTKWVNSDCTCRRFRDRTVICARCRQCESLGGKVAELLPLVRSYIFAGLEPEPKYLTTGTQNNEGHQYTIPSGAAIPDFVDVWFHLGSLDRIEGPAEVLLRKGGVLDFLRDREPLTRGVGLTTWPEMRETWNKRGGGPTKHRRTRIVGRKWWRVDAIGGPFYGNDNSKRALALLAAEFPWTTHHLPTDPEGPR